MEITQYIKTQKEILKTKAMGLKVKPTLLIIQVNDDPASNSYIRGKLKDAVEVGFSANVLKLPEDITQVELLSHIKRANSDSSIHGIIVQLPLPKQIDPEAIKLAVIPEKDVDGFHPMTRFAPCTPMGIIDYLEEENIAISGKNALVIGRSDIVGKPVAKLLLERNATVAIAHSKTSEQTLRLLVENADIIVVAVGIPGFLNDSYTINKKAYIIDVGINKTDNGLVGDVQPNLDVALQTPVPGGVGLLTRLRLIKNLWEAYVHGIQD